MSHLASPAQPRGTWAKPGTDENDDSDLDERPTRRASGMGVEETRFLLLCKGTVCLEKLLRFICVLVFVGSIFVSRAFFLALVFVT